MGRGGSPDSRFTLFLNQLEGDRAKIKGQGHRFNIWQICMGIELLVDWILVYMHQGTLLSLNCETLANWIISCFPGRVTLDPGIGDVDEFPGTSKLLAEKQVTSV